MRKYFIAAFYSVAYSTRLSKNVKQVYLSEVGPYKEVKYVYASKQSK